MQGIRTIVKNRRALHEYEIVETIEAGISLLGTEVKSIKAGMVSLKGAYCDIIRGEAWLLGMHVSPWPNALFNHEPERPRKLLLHKHEIRRLIGKIRERGMTLVPLSIYERRGIIKVELALVRGRRKPDKRERIRRRDEERQMARELKERW